MTIDIEIIFFFFWKRVESHPQMGQASLESCARPLWLNLHCRPNKSGVFKRFHRKLNWKYWCKTGLRTNQRLLISPQTPSTESVIAGKKTWLSVGLKRMKIEVCCTFYNKLVIILLFYLNNIIFPVSQGISSYIWPTSKVSSLQKNCPSIAFVCNSTIHGGNIHLVLDISDITAPMMMLTKTLP